MTSILAIQALVRTAPSLLHAQRSVFLPQAVRLFSTSMIHKSASPEEVAKWPIHPGYAKNKERQRLYQIDDGLPIHMKGGAKTRLLNAFIGVMFMYCSLLAIDTMSRLVKGKK